MEKHTLSAFCVEVSRTAPVSPTSAPGGLLGRRRPAAAHPTRACLTSCAATSFPDQGGPARPRLRALSDTSHHLLGFAFYSGFAFYCTATGVGDRA